MNPIGLNYDFNPTVHLLVGQLDTFGMSFRSYREPLKRAVQQVMAPSFKKNFDLGGRPPWQELKDETITQRNYLGATGGTLVKTGLLRKVAQQLNLWKIGTDEAMIQQMPRAQYGAVHQEGSERVPQREWAVVQPEDMDQIEEIFVAWVAERLVAAGFVGGSF